MQREVEELYNFILEAENQSPDPNERIRVVGLSKQSPEISSLRNSGATESDLDSGYLPRKILTDSGYVFLNRIGGGEKPIINVQIPVDEDSHILDIRHRVLLTQSELDAVVRYQQKICGVISDIDAMRKDMLLFLAEGIVASADVSSLVKEIFLKSKRKIISDPKYTNLNESQLNAYLFKNRGDLGFIVAECLQGITLARVRGVPIEVFSTRRGILEGVPSPFLNSGYHFGDNLDLTLYPNDPRKTRRLNMVVFHVLSRGLSEMVESQNGSHDQTYLTAQEYQRDLLGKSSPERFAIPEEDIDLAAFRLYYRACIMLGIVPRESL